MEEQDFSWWFFNTNLLVLECTRLCMIFAWLNPSLIFNHWGVYIHRFYLPCLQNLQRMYWGWKLINNSFQPFPYKWSVWILYFVFSPFWTLFTFCKSEVTVPIWRNLLLTDLAGFQTDSSFCCWNRLRTLFASQPLKRNHFPKYLAKMANRTLCQKHHRKTERTSSKSSPSSPPQLLRTNTLLR